MPQTVVVLDFGSQYTQVIARRIREAKVFSQVVSFDTSAKEIEKLSPVGIVLSGGPASVLAKDAPRPDAAIFRLGVPILGICYGLQLMGAMLGGKVKQSTAREYGRGELQIKRKGKLFSRLPKELLVWNSHGDRLVKLPKGFSSIASTENSAYASIEDTKRNFYGLQFHPEVAHTPLGMSVLDNFLQKVCQCKQDWTPGNFVSECTTRIKDQVGNAHVICALSGGVDSSVTALLLHKAIGDQLTCIFVNNGLLRKGEAEAVQNTFKNNLGLNLIYIDAADRFIEKLENITDPEQKRKVIGEEFIRVFEEVSSDVSHAEYLAQGTLYPDVIESETPDNRASARIKTHHNVGGLPEDMKLKLVEPLRYLFKDEVRDVGVELGLAREMVYRQPFPGPGLAIRIIGKITKEKLHLLQECDAIVLEEIRNAGLYEDIWQSFAVLSDNRTVGVMGDYRTYGYVCAIRAVSSDDAMTADWVRLPYDLLAQISSRIVNEVTGVNRVVYDITSKPPGTIEWE